MVDWRSSRHRRCLRLEWRWRGTCGSSFCKTGACEGCCCIVMALPAERDSCVRSMQDRGAAVGRVHHCMDLGEVHPHAQLED
jgi:hypothetical protein